MEQVRWIAIDRDASRLPQIVSAPAPTHNADCPQVCFAGGLCVIDSVAHHKHVIGAYIAELRERRLKDIRIGFRSCGIIGRSFTFDQIVDSGDGFIGFELVAFGRRSEHDALIIMEDSLE